MANSIDQSFIKQFNTEVKLAYALESQLMPVVRKHMNVVGSTDRFQKLGGISANTKSRSADLTFLEATHSYVDVTLADAYVPLIIDSLDVFKTNVDTQKEYSKTIANAMAKKCDEIIVAAATAGSVTTTTTAGGFTFAKLREVIKYFTNNRVPTKDRVIVVGGSQLAEILAITELTSADYASINAVMKGEVNQAMGLTWVVMPDDMIPTATSVASCFAFSKDAIGVSVGQEPKTRIDYSVDKAADVLLGTLSMGAAIIDGAGVVEIPCAVQWKPLICLVIFRHFYQTINKGIPVKRYAFFIGRKMSAEESRKAATKRYYEEHKNDPEQKAKAKEASRRSYERNKDKVKEQATKWRKDNREEWLATKRRNSSKTKENRPSYNHYHAIKCRAKKKGLTFDLVESDLVVPEFCPVLGIPLTYTPGAKTDNSPSVDRIDSSKGYTKDNIEVISWRANNLKKDATLDELRALVRYMEQHEDKQA